MRLIAEIGQAHEGSLGMALSYVRALAATGVDAVKFQLHLASAESSMEEPFRVPLSIQDKSRYDYWKRMEFLPEEWQVLKRFCEQCGVEFLASPFSVMAVDLLEELGVREYKIGSGEMNNRLMLEKIAHTGKPVILSSGMSSFAEIDRTVAFLHSRRVPFSLLQCTTAYPTLPEDYGLNLIDELWKRYQVPVGYSDHSGRVETGIAAFVLGADILEFHAVFDRRSFGPDASSSLEIDEIAQLVMAVRNLQKAFQNPVDKDTTSVRHAWKNQFEKSLSVNKPLQRGHVLTFEDLESKKPKGMGISAENFKEVLGKILVRDLRQWEFLQEEDVDKKA